MIRVTHSLKSDPWLSRWLEHPDVESGGLQFLYRIYYNSKGPLALPIIIGMVRGPGLV